MEIIKIKQGRARMILEALQKKIPEYNIKIVTENTIEDVLKLMQSNQYYCSKTQQHEVTKEECIEDIQSIPPGVDYSKKTYVVFYEENGCIALVDFVEGYPNEKTGYLGLLLLDANLHRRGTGKKILNCLLSIAKEEGFQYMELACHECNARGFAFWSKMGFKEIRKSKRETDGKIYTLVSMQREV